jgi:hypothetical protein
MDEQAASSKVEALNRVITALNPLDTEARSQILSTVATFFGLLLPTTSAKSGAIPIDSTIPGSARTSFSEDRTLSPKDFLLEKKPLTDVERVACLAYYLTHYRNQPYFKTFDLSQLNTEAAQVKFSNAAWASSNALKQGYLAEASAAQRQISAAGERFVRELPDREAARTAMAAARRRQKVRRVPRVVDESDHAGP